MPLNITVPSNEFYVSGKFYTVPQTTLTLEHSLLSLRKWESKWEVPLLKTMDESQITEEQWRDYIRMMTLTKNVNPLVYYSLTQKNFDDIIAYMDRPMTAAKFSETKAPHGSGKFVSAETILFGMFENHIPLECQKWHLNQLQALIRYCNNERTPKQKMSKDDILKRNKALNKARRKPRMRKP